MNGTCGDYWSSYGYTCATGEPVWAETTRTRYAYSPLDLLTTVTDAQANVTMMTYDSLGRKRTMSDPDMGAWSYQYDPDGNLVSQTDAKNQTISFGYDALSRLRSKVVPGTGTVTYTRDEQDSQRNRPYLSIVARMCSVIVGNPAQHDFRQCCSPDSRHRPDFPDQLTADQSPSSSSFRSALGSGSPPPRRTAAR